MAERTFLVVGWLLAATGLSLFLLFGAYLGGLTLPALTEGRVSGAGYYLAATAGSAMIGWGTILILTAGQAALRGLVAIGTGAGLLTLSLVRLWLALSGEEAADPVTLLPIGEIILFFALAILFFQIGADFWSRLMDAFRSLCAAPVWVQVWVWAFLLTANMSAVVLYGITKHPLPGWAALGFVFIVLTNMTLVLYERGISKLASLPHLIPWVPLQIYAGYWVLARGEDLTPILTAFGWFYFIVIGISNLFDAYDTWRWFRGERSVLGAERRG